MEGFIKLYRPLLTHSVFRHPIALKIWIWCLLKASYKESSALIKISKADQVVKVEPGQFIFGRKTASKELDIPGTTVNRWLKKFESDFQLITRKVNGQYTVITICKWASYQESTQNIGQATDRQRTGNGQATDTYKNSKESKEDKEEEKIDKKENPKIKYADKVLLTSDEYQKLIERFGESETRSWIEELNNYKFAHGRKYKSDYHAILSWEKKRSKEARKDSDTEDKSYAANAFI